MAVATDLDEVNEMKGGVSDGQRSGELGSHGRDLTTGGYYHPQYWKLNWIVGAWKV